MSCSHYQEAIALRAGGELPEVQLAAVEAHLQGCPECAQLAKELDLTRAQLSALRTTGVTAESLAPVRAAVWARLAESHSAGEARRERHRLAPAALAMAAMLALVVGLAAFWLARRPASEPGAPSGLGVPSAPPKVARMTSPPHSSQAQPLTPPLAPPSAPLAEETRNSAAPPAPTTYQAPTRVQPLQLAEVAAPAASAEHASISAPHRRAKRPAATFTPPTISPRQPVTKRPQGLPRAASVEPLRIQLVSADEALVIYWLVDPEEISDETSD